MSSNPITSEYLGRFKISLFEPFSDFLLGSEGEKRFELSLLDIVRFAGHACPSMVGAFLVAQAAIEFLYPDTKIGVRGHIEVDIPHGSTDGPTGPMANVFGYITGAWGETGFGGLQGRAFVRRNLLRFNSPNVQHGFFRFTRSDSGASCLVSYAPERAEIQATSDSSEPMPFQLLWRHKIRAILENPRAVVTVVNA